MVIEREFLTSSGQRRRGRSADDAVAPLAIKHARRAIKNAARTSHGRNSDHTAAKPVLYHLVTVPGHRRERTQTSWSLRTPAAVSLPYLAGLPQTSLRRPRRGESAPIRDREPSRLKLAPDEGPACRVAGAAPRLRSGSKPSLCLPRRTRGASWPPAPHRDLDLQRERRNRRQCAPLDRELRKSPQGFTFALARF